MSKFIFIIVILLGSYNSTFCQKKKIISDGGTGEYYRYGNKITYDWVFRDVNNHSYNFSISLIYNRGWNNMKSAYRKKNHVHGDHTKFIRDDPFKKDLILLAGLLQKQAWERGVSKTQLALSFVQALPYQVMGGYQKYAVETLIDASGDCSDKAILLAGIYKVWEYDCIFLDFPDHLAVGIWSSSIPGGRYWNHRGRRFYFCETTNTNCRIGFCADEWDWADFYEVKFY